MRRLVFLSVLVLLLASVTANAQILTNLRVQPNSSASASNYWYLDPDTLSTFYSYNDGNLNVLQDWYGTLYYRRSGGSFVTNVSRRRSAARYTLDYDNYSIVQDQSAALANRDGSWLGMGQDGIVLYLPFENPKNTTRTLDWSIFRHDASRYGPTLNVSCHKGFCYHFQRVTNNFLQVNHTSRLIPGAFSGSAWIRPLSVSGGSTWRIINKGGDGYGGWKFQHTNNVLEFVATNNSGYQYNAQATGLVAGQWQHVMWVYGGCVLRVYINGVIGSQQQVTKCETLFQNTSRIEISDQTDNAFAGNIDEVYLFNRTLQQTEVLKLYDDSCYQGYCYNLDGVNDALSFTPTSDINISKNFTVLLRASIRNANYEQVLFAKSNGASGGSMKFALSIQNGVVRGGYYNGSFRHNASGAVSTGQYHIAYTYAGATSARFARLYLNGSVQSGQATSSSSGSEPFGMRVGARTDNARFYNGTIDDVLIVNRTISAAEAQLYFLEILKNGNVGVGSYRAEYNITNRTVLGRVASAVTNLSGGSTNVTIYDETTGVRITSQIVSLDLNEGIHFYSYSTPNGRINISNLFAGSWSYTFSAGGYEPRTYIAATSGLPVVTLKAYLTNSTSAVTLSIKDQYTGRVLEGVLVTMYRTIGGIPTPLESKYSDVTGRVQFNYLPGSAYTFYLSKSGYEQRVFTLNPVIFSDYTVQMVPTSSVNETLDYGGLAITWTPTVFYDGVAHQFRWVIASGDGALSAYGFNLSYPGGVSSASGVTALGEVLSKNFTILNADAFSRVVLSYHYVTADSGYRSFTYSYPVVVFGSNATMMGLRDKTYGLGLFERLLILTVAGLLVLGISALAGKPTIGLVICLFVFGYFVYIGFVPIWTVLISFFVGLLVVSWRSEP